MLSNIKNYIRRYQKRRAVRKQLAELGEIDIASILVRRDMVYIGARRRGFAKRVLRRGVTYKFNESGTGLVIKE